MGAVKFPLFVILVLFLSLFETSKCLRFAELEYNNNLLDNWWDTFSTSWTRYEETLEILEEMEEAFPNNVQLYSIGQTVEKREMLVIRLGTNVQEDRGLLVTPIKLVGNMHGDESLGRALLLMLTVDILGNYFNGDPRAVRLLNHTELHIMPSMNVDGFEAVEEGECRPSSSDVGRLNANFQDLNRDFPDQFVHAGKSFKDLLKGRQPETVNMMKWITSTYFVLSANFHALTVVASYPFDSVPVELENNPHYFGQGVISVSPDHKVFFKLATLYSENHKTMHLMNNCTHGKFANGVTNGAEWYNVRGGMQDFNYMHSNTFDVTFELSCCKFPPKEDLLVEWGNNKEALWKYVEASHWGIMGIVSAQNGEPISHAVIHVEGINHTVKTTPQGEFWRLLVPGFYNVWAEAKGFLNSKTVQVIVPENQKLQVRLDFILEDNGEKWEAFLS